MNNLNELSRSDLSAHASVPVPAWPNPIQAWYVVSVLTFGSVLAYVDRNVVTVIIEPMKHDLVLSDAQVSLLSGFSFAVFFALAGIPLGRAIDGLNRRRVILVASCLWTLMTALCGWCGSFGSLFLTRMGVGIGEAALTPGALSLVGDYFPPSKRHFPISVYVLGATVGTATAYLGGALALSIGKSLTASGVEFFGTHSAWQWTLILVAVPGAIFVPLMALIREPVRREILRVGSGSAEPNSLRALLSFSRLHWKTYTCLLGAASLMSFVSYGLQIWMVSFFVRVHGWTPGQTAAWMGPATLIVGPGGNLLVAWLSRRLSRKGYADAIMRTGVYLGCAGVIPIVVGLLMPNPYLVLLIAFPGFGVVGNTAMLALIGIQLTVPNQMRGQFSAVYSFVANLLGMGLGPTFIAILTDYVYRDESKLQYSLATAAAIVIPLGIALFALGMKYMRRTVADTQSSIGS